MEFGLKRLRGRKIPWGKREGRKDGWDSTGDGRCQGVRLGRKRRGEVRRKNTPDDSSHVIHHLKGKTIGVPRLGGLGRGREEVASKTRVVGVKKAVSSN